MWSTSKNFPSYSEQTECEGKLTWGDVKLGRLPSSLYDDVVVGSMHSSHDGQTSHSVQSPPDASNTSYVVRMDAANLADAEKYKGTFDRIFNIFKSDVSIISTSS